jgi:glycosyltransferase involved in cell wall biosynthesis
VVGFVGGSVLRKGVYYLLKAWKQLGLKDGKLLLKASQSGLQEVPKIWSLIEGDPSIEIVGYVEDMEDFYRRCDLFVLPSIDEGFGMVVFEAMACSLPVIITQNVGSGDFIEDGKQGYIVDIRDPNAIEEKVRYLNQNRDLMSSMSQKALETFQHYQEREDNYKSRVKKLYSNGRN